MSQAVRGRTGPVDAAKDWEDEYRRLRTKFDDLKIEYNDIDMLSKQQKVRIAKLESGMAEVGVTKADREERERSDVLQEKLRKMTSLNSKLQESVHILTDQLEKKKKELALARKSAAASHASATGSLKRPLSATRDRSQKPEVEVVIGPNHHQHHAQVVHKYPEEELDDTNWHETALKLQAKLNAAMEQLSQLREENARLKNTPAAVNKVNTADVDLQDLKWRYNQLQTQYDYINSKYNAHMEGSKHSEVKLEEYHQKVNELRRSLEELRFEKEISDAKAARVDALEDTVSELRQLNRSLEEKIHRLCEAPFISDAFGLHESKMRYEDLARERGDLIAKLEHLQEAVRTQYSALTSLRQQATQLREEKEKADKIAEDLRNQLHDLQAGQNLMQDQLRLYSGDEGVDVTTLERALTMVKRSSEPYGKLPFLEDPDGEKLVSLPAVKRKLEEYQILNLRLTEENERLESMLKLQTGISRDLHKEVEALVRSRDKDKQDLLQKAEDFESIALKRLDKIHSLEAQVRQYVYGLAKNAKGPRDVHQAMVVTPDDKGHAADTEADNALLNELIEDKGGHIRDDENLLEIWIKGATIKEGILTPGSSSFVVVDFFDYESQTTSLLSSLKPQWDFAATYKITVDDFLLRYLATDVITLELNMASQGDFAMLARCTVPISALLKSRPRLQLVNHPMLSVKTGQVIAHISLDVRLALPVSELYRLFLERHPAERRHIEELSAQRVIEAASNNELSRNLDGGLTTALALSGKEDESRLYNELDILIHRASGLPLSADNAPPNAYVHFQLLGHPDKLTNPIMHTTSPEFNEKFTFPMVTTDQQMRLLQRSQLQLSVIDMKGEEMEMKDEGLIGEVFVKLASLTEGAQITDTFNIKNTDGKNIAELYITLKWKHPLKRHRDLGPRALSGVEIETLISAFCPGDFQEGVIDYKAFCRFVDPPSQALFAMDKLRAFCHEITEREGKSARDVFKILLDPQDYIDEDTFVQRLLKTQVDVLPMDLVHLFKHVDNSQEQRVTLDKFLAVLNLDEIAGLPTLLQGKLRDRCKDLNSRGIPVLKLFQEADQWGADGLITRTEFKNVLMKRMGFALVDEPDPVHDYIGEGEAPTTARGRKGSRVAVIEEDENDVLNDTLGSEDNILQQSDTVGGAPPRSGGPGGVQAAMKQKREIFDEKVADFQQRSQKALALEAKNNSNKPSMAVNLLEMDPAHPLLDAADPYKSGEDHRVSVGNSSKGRPITHDASLTDKSATKLQSHFRGYQTRKNTPLKGRSSQEPPIKAGKSPFRDVAPADYSQNLAGASSILAVENILYDSLKAFSEGQALPDLAAGFLKVDQRKTGLVNRKQFAHVLQQYPAVQLYGAELRAAMDFFDVSGSGSSIDYNAFLRLFNYREPELLPAILKLQTMTLSKNSILQFRQYDQTGKGLVRRAEMMKVLKELGHSVISQSVMQTILQLFEVRLDGHVNYVNFFEYVRESDLTQKLDHLSVQFYQLVTQGGSPHDPAVREWFSQLDKPNNGKFTLPQLSMLLKEFEIPAVKQAVLALYQQMDPDGVGVPFGRFTQWLVHHAESSKEADSQLSLFSSLTIAELQRKANTYVLAVAGSPVGLEMLSDSYLVYDWRRSDSGAIAKALFVRATRRAGFPFTMNELRTLTSEFSLQNNGEVVSYKKFLAWATPSTRVAAPMNAGIADDAMSSLDGGGPGSVSTPRKNSGVITKFLEKCVLRSVDLLTVFGRYDSINVGRVTSSEFCAALSDMGLSSVTQRDALELADRYRAAAGDFILYRRIVTELLRHVDEVTGAADVDPVEVLRGALQTSKVELRRLQDVFEYYDTKGNGNVLNEDLETILDEAKLKIKKFEIDSIRDKYSLPASNRMNYTPLLKALEGRMVERSMFKKPNVLSDEVSSKVKALIETLIIRGKNYRAEFDKFDDQYTGTILQADFREVMNERLRANFTQKELDALEKNYRSNEDPRKVHFVRMIHHLHPRNFGRVTFQSPEQASLGEPWEIAEQLRQKIRRRCDFTSPGEVRGPFRHFTRNKTDNQSVSQEDFSVAVRKLGMRLASDQDKAVFDMITLSGKTSFKYNDFVVFVCDPQHIDIIWKLRRAIARARVSEKEIINALNEQDTNSSGLITAKQFLRAMQHCSIELSDSDALRLMLRFDVEDNQRFDNDRFFRFLRGKQYEDDDAAELNDLELAVTKRLHDEKVLDARKSAEAADTHAWGSLKRRVEEKLLAGFTGNEVFGLFDRDGKGTLDVAALSHGIQRLGLTLTNAEIRAMLRRMTVLAGGTVSKASFFEALDIDLRVFAVDDRDLVGGETGRRTRRSRVGIDDPDERSELDALPARQGFVGIVAHIKEQLEIAINPRDRHELPEVFRRALDKMSHQKIGFSTHRELSRSLESLGVRTPGKDIIKIFDKLDEEGLGILPHEAIVVALFPDAARSTKRGSSADERADSDVRTALRKRPDLLEELVSQLKSIESQHERTLEDLQTIFKKSDFERSGSLGKNDFALCLAKFGFKLVAGMERDLVDTLTAQSASRVRYDDFLDALRVDIRSDSVLDDVILRLRKHVSRDEKHGEGIEKIFSRIDRDNDGEVDVYEFEAALDKIGIPISREEAKRIVKRFSANGTTIRFRDFLRAFHTTSSGTSKHEALDPIVRRIRAAIERSGGSAGGPQEAGRVLKRAFERVDVDGSGKLSKAEFSNALVNLKIEVSPSEIRQIFETYNGDRGGDLSYAGFLSLMDASVASAEGRGGSSRERPTVSVQLKEDTDLIVSTIRRKLKDYLGPGAGSARKIKDTFSEMDADRSGTIDKREFEKALAVLRVEVSPADLRILFERFDPNHNGLDYVEFLQLLDFNATGRVENRVSAKLQEDVDLVLSSIRRKLKDYLGPGASSARKIKESFAEIDANRSGTIDKREFEKAMSVLRVEISAADIRILFERFDPNSNGLDYQEFLELLDFNGGGKEEASGAGRAVSAQLKEDSDAVLASIRRKLESYLGPGASSARKIKDAFLEIDSNKNGTIDKREFERTMSVLRVEVNPADVRILFERFDPNHNGLDYNEFIELVGFKQQSSSSRGDEGKESSGVKISTQLRQDTDAIVANIRRKLEDYLGPGASSARKIREAFEDMDANRNGTIDKREFETAMTVLKVHVAKPDIQLLYERFDPNRNGLDYVEFMGLLGFDGGARSSSSAGGSSSSRGADESKYSSGAKVSSQLRQDTDEIVDNIRRKLEDYLGPGSGSARKIREAFEDMDGNRNGTIDKREFERALSVLRVNISARDIGLLFERFDTNRNGLDYKEFIDLIGFPSSPRKLRF